MFLFLPTLSHLEIDHVKSVCCQEYTAGDFQTFFLATQISSIIILRDPKQKKRMSERDELVELHRVDPSLGLFWTQHTTGQHFNVFWVFEMLI